MIEAYKIQSEIEADTYLEEMFDKPEYRSIDEVMIRASRYIIDEPIRRYFIHKAKEMLAQFASY
jgi:hypothetical protein